ncbi:MAG: hypothetical protein NXH83_17655 [Rhodobacteraceae bacterium]|nr:hypothetical protein [Paracoccaceae bacterium]
MGRFPHSAPRATIDADNPAGTDGFGEDDDTALFDPIEQDRIERGVPKAN